ncbi:MAG: cbb3-type cytochrome c oxidase subunit 3 [Halieaceae bacterium]|nr:cbb3-type cytochrome c oxidase subunit 3 [Halieaceae bacterium]
MDINTVRGLTTLLLLIAFIGLVIVVYSRSNKSRFDEAANLPFADEEAHRQTMAQTLAERETGADTAHKEKQA